MSNGPEQESGMGGLAVLDDLCNAFATHVKRTKVMLRDGSVLNRVLRAQYRDHRIELISNERLMLIDVEAKYGQFSLLVLTAAGQRGIRSAGKIVTASGQRYELSAIAHEEFSEEQASLIASGAVQNILESVTLREGEEINISQKLVRMHLRSPKRERVMAFINAVVDFMPHEQGRNEPFTLEGLPDWLRPLIPLLAKWAISDDEERSHKPGGALNPLG